MSDQHEEESLRRSAREQAEIERQTDALVLRTMTGMVTAAEDLKSRLRRDTESILEGFQRAKRGLENEISLAAAERQRFRRETEQERDSMLAAARAEAQEIVRAAQQEREQLLGEVRVMEQRLRSLEAQIRSALGLEPDGPVPVEPPGSPAEAPGSPVRATVKPGEAPIAPADPQPLVRPFAPAPAAQAAPAAAAPPPAAAAPPAAPTTASAPSTGATGVPGGDRAAADASPSGQGAPAQAVVAPGPAIEPAPPVAAAAGAGTEPGAVEGRPVPAAAHRRPVELVFDSVPGYQHASALERAVSDLVPDEDVDIVEFEHGQLILSVAAADLAGLARRLVASSAATLELDAVDGDRATFRCV